MILAFLFFDIHATTKEKYELNYAPPPLPAENVFLIDISKYREQNSVTKSEITFYANNQNSIILYGNNPENKNWEQLSVATFRGFSDNKTLYFSNKAAKNWRYFSISPNKNFFYNYKITVRNRILYIEIRGKNDDFAKPPLPRINVKDAQVFDIEKYGAEDYLVIKNYTKSNELMCIPYYFDKKTFKWERAFEIAFFNRPNDSCKLEVIDDEGIEEIKYLAINVIPSGKYFFNLHENSDDLYIDIYDGHSNDNAGLDLMEDDINNVED